MNDRILKTALKAVERSKEEYRLAAVIFDKHKIISVGINSKRHSNKLHPNFRKWEGSIHAEQDCILRARTDLRRASMLVIRVNKQGELRLALPCIHCQQYIHYVGIKKCYYSDSTGEIKLMEVR